MRLDKNLEVRLIEFGKALINQEKARLIINPYGNSSGFWFGGGNIVKDKKTGKIFICGRYRNPGDSRFGISKGERGLELAIFKTDNKFEKLEKIKSWSKKELEYNGMEVLSIEGSAILLTDKKVEIFVSSEKKIPYPEGFKNYQKEGTGIWSIDVFYGRDIENIEPVNIRNILSSKEPEFLHLKDPVVFNKNGDTYMIFCQHPFCWSTSFSGLAVRRKGKKKFEIIARDILPRGYTWDVAVTRITERVPVPKIGKFKNLPDISLYFYDGAECIKEHPSSKKVKIPKGYSCEEIGGLAYGFDDEFPTIYKLSKYFPLFYSPEGTGCSRYVSVLYDEGEMVAIWQKSSSDFSQPLVMNKLTEKEIREILE